MESCTANVLLEGSDAEWGYLACFVGDFSSKSVHQNTVLGLKKSSGAWGMGGKAVPWLVEGE